MEKMVTSAYANKLLKQLEEDRAYWRKLENESDTYLAASNEEPVIPAYDYETVSATLAEIDRKAARIKHAINLYNTTTVLELEDGTAMTIDEALVVMAQLNSRKSKLDTMRKRLPKDRASAIYRGGNTLVEYRYVNYDPERVKADFESISARVMDIQLKLDQANQTIMFPVDL